MINSGWVPINDYPGDQQYDHVPGTTEVTYWGEIGTSYGRWSWTILACNEEGDYWEAAGGEVDTEAEAKTQVENWKP